MHAVHPAGCACEHQVAIHVLQVLLYRPGEFSVIRNVAKFASALYVAVADMACLC